METLVRSELCGWEFDVDVGIVTIHSQDKGGQSKRTRHEVDFVAHSRSIFPDVHAAGENDLDSLSPAGTNLSEALSTGSIGAVAKRLNLSFRSPRAGLRPVARQDSAAALVRGA